MRGRLELWAGTRRIVLETAAFVAVIVAVKLVLDAFSLEYISLSPLYTSVVGGAIFVIGLIVAGVLSDYKESERMPAEITGSLETLLEDARIANVSHPEFDLVRFRLRLCTVVDTFRSDLAAPDDRACLAAINDLSGSIYELEQLGLPPNYIVRLRAEQSSIRKNVLRIYHIQRTEFLPSAYALIESIIALIIVGLLMTKIEPGRDAIVLVVLISYFFVFMIKLLKIIDTPFQPSRASRDDISLFLLREFVDRTQPLTAQPHNSSPS